MLQVKAVSCEARGLGLKVDTKKVKLHSNCSVTITVLEEQLETEVFSDTFRPPFQENIHVGGLQPSTLYRIKYSVINGQTNQTLNLFTFTKSSDHDSSENTHENRNQNNNNQPMAESRIKRNTNSLTGYPLSNTQALIRSVGKINNIMSNKELDRAILAARYSKDTSDFVMAGHKSLRPDKREDRIKRTMLISHGIQVADTIYKHSEGRELFKNDWFMGPFYSYDRNSAQMKRP